MPQAFSRPSAWPTCQARIKGKHGTGEHSPGGQAGAGARSLMAAKCSRSCAAPSGHLPEPSCDSLLILPNVRPLSVSTLEHAAPPPAGGLLQRTESPPRPCSELQRRHLPSTFVWAGASARSGDEAHTVRPRGSPLTVSHLPLELVPKHKRCPFTKMCTTAARRQNHPSTTRPIAVC